MKNEELIKLVIHAPNVDPLVTVWRGKGKLPAIDSVITAIQWTMAQDLEHTQKLEVTVLEEDGYSYQVILTKESGGFSLGVATQSEYRNDPRNQTIAAKLREQLGNQITFH